MSNTTLAQKKAIAYYDYMVDFYKFWFVSSKASALHYGFSELGSHSFHGSLLNTNKYLAEVATIVKGDHVLDAGCGIGGSSVWIVETIGCTVTGITISSAQIKQAQKLSRKRGQDTKTTFIEADYDHIPVPDNSFDVVWGLESVCHSTNKVKTLQELFRVLKPGGRIVIGDGYLLRPPQNNKEHEWLDEFQSGFAIPPLVQHEQFQAALSEAGFKDIQGIDTTEKVKASSKRMYYLCQPSYHMARLLQAIHITSPILTANNLAGITQWYCVRRNLTGYYVFLATKS